MPSLRCRAGDGTRLSCVQLAKLQLLERISFGWAGFLLQSGHDGYVSIQAVEAWQRDLPSSHITSKIAHPCGFFPAYLPMLLRSVGRVIRPAVLITMLVRHL
jgi:hypothetical protein